MLSALKVRNYAIIEELEITFGPGLNVLTGETGAGKSILVGALGICLGARAYSEMVKTGAAEASVEAFFDTPSHQLLEQLGIDAPAADNDGIILRRVVSSAGKSRAYVNGTMVNLQALASVGRRLVDIHGQNEHQSLLQPATQLKLLDTFGSLGGLRAEVYRAFSEVEAEKRRIDKIKSSAEDATRRVELLRFQAGEIEAAGLVAGEDDTLKAERDILSNFGRLAELIESAHSGLYGEEGSVVEKLTAANNSIAEMAALDPGVKDSLEVLKQALALSEDAAHSLRAHKDKYDADPARLDAVHERLELIKDLKRKYGPSLEEVLGFLSSAKEELEGATTSGEALKEAEQALEKMSEALSLKAAGLSKMRREAAVRLESETAKVLGTLALKKAELKLAVAEAPLSETGLDAVELMFSANPGEALKTLGKVVSGGELSRVMLAIKSVLRGADETPVLIFDEVDAGIGGKTALNVARKLRDTSVGRQVLCVTHLPQIAASADVHFSIEKSSSGGRVRVSLRSLGAEERTGEIARMLGGSVTDTSLKHARELLDKGPGKQAGL